MQFVDHSNVNRIYSYVIRTRIRMSFLCVCNSFVCTGMPFLSHSHVLVCHPYVTRIYSYVIRISLVCHPYVTRMFSYVIRMSLACSRMSFVSHSYVIGTRMSSVCHSGFTMSRYIAKHSKAFFFPYFNLNICSLFIYFMFDVLL